MNMWVFHFSYTGFCFTRVYSLSYVLLHRKAAVIEVFAQYGIFSAAIAYGVVFWFLLFVSLCCGPFIHFYCIIHCDQWNLFPFTKRKKKKKKKSSYTWLCILGYYGYFVWCSFIHQLSNLCMYLWDRPDTHMPKYVPSSMCIFSCCSIQYLIVSLPIFQNKPILVQTCCLKSHSIVFFASFSILVKMEHCLFCGYGNSKFVPSYAGKTFIIKGLLLLVWFRVSTLLSVTAKRSEKVLRPLLLLGGSSFILSCSVNWWTMLVFPSLVPFMNSNLLRPFVTTHWREDLVL